MAGISAFDDLPCFADWFYDWVRPWGHHGNRPELPRTGQAWKVETPIGKRETPNRDLAPARSTQNSLTADSPNDLPRRPRTEDKLTDRQRLILETMFAMEATERNLRQPQGPIVGRIQPGHDADNYKRDFAFLGKHGFTESIRGPDGGVWLTPQGISVAREN
jgi:hypothetical protein